MPESLLALDNYLSSIGLLVQPRIHIEVLQHMQHRQRLRPEYRIHCRSVIRRVSLTEDITRSDTTASTTSDKHGAG